MSTTALISFATGQAVTWPPAPGRLAQVEELRRTKVRLFYRCRTGRERRPVVPAATLWAMQHAEREPPLPLRNAMGRGCLPRAKAFGPAGGGAASRRNCEPPGPARQAA
jgi:hypothetical protein